MACQGALLSLGSTALAQTPARLRHTGLESKDLLVVWQSAAARWTRGSTEGNLATDTDLCGDALAFLSDDRWILVGRRSRDRMGRILRVTWTGQTYSIAQSIDVPGADFCGVWWEDQYGILYVLDVAQGRISWVPYADPSQPFPPWSAWSVLADHTSLPELAPNAPRRELYDLGPSTGGPNGRYPILAVETYQTLAGPTRLHRYLIHHRPDGVQVVDTGIYPPPSCTIEDFVSPGAQQLSIACAGADRVEVLRVDTEPHQVVGSAALPADAERVVVPITPLQRGAVYGARSIVDSGPGTLSMVKTPIRVWGQAMPMPHGGRFHQDEETAMLCFVGSQFLQTAAKVYYAAPAQVPVPLRYEACLVLGIEGVSGTTPVPNQPGALLLNGFGVVPLTIEASDARFPAIGTVPLPIPADENLADAVLMVQWVVRTSADEFAVSAIHGWTIRERAWETEFSKWFFGRMNRLRNAPDAAAPPPTKPRETPPRDPAEILAEHWRATNRAFRAFAADDLAAWLRGMRGR